MADYGVVLVVGATGETGPHVVRILQQHGIPVRALVRSAEKADAIKGAGVDIRIGDLGTDISLAPIMEGVQGVISVLGSRALGDPELRDKIEYQAVVNLVDAAKQAGVQHFVFTTSSSTEHPERIPFLTEMLRVKRRAELYLIDSGLPYTIVRPGGLVNDPATNDVRVGRGDTITGRISRADVAQVLVQALLQPEALNQIVEIVSEPGAGAADRPSLFA